MKTGKPYTLDAFLLESLMPHAQALLFRYAAGEGKEEDRPAYKRLLCETIRAYKRGGFLPLVDEEYIDRLERYLKRYLEQPGLKTRLSPELCRMVASLHLPGAVHFAEARLLEAFGEKVATA